MTRGGWRGGGRPKLKEPTISYHRRVRKEHVKLLDKYLEELKKQII